MPILPIGAPCSLVFNSPTNFNLSYFLFQLVCRMVAVGGDILHPHISLQSYDVGIRTDEKCFVRGDTTQNQS